jgi:anti-sigma regulatory factor (Ser/Thr protein kinase)
LRLQRRLDLTVHGTSDTIAAALDALAGLGRQVHFPEDRVDEILTAVGEALTNAMQHAHGSIAEREIGLRVAADRDRVVVDVEDSGGGLDSIPPLPDLEKKLLGAERPTGWGVFLMRSLASEVVFSHTAGGRHQVRLVFGRTPPAAPVPARIAGGRGVV